MTETIDKLRTPPQRSPLPPHPEYPASLGARLLPNGHCRFRVWAPRVDQLELHLVAPQEQLLPMRKEANGYFELEVEDLQPGAEYFYRLEGHDRPDPASKHQPQGVHQASAVTATDFDWQDVGWRGIPFTSYITYELHIGTFSPAGTFDGAIDYLDDLVDLGITAVEIMPVAQFPGDRNWGYDGVHPFAPQNSYGGPDGLKRLVDAAHARELAVVLDVVYNHLGPEGNYLGEFADYFTDRYRTPWGSAINFDGPGSDDVRRFFIENALYWIDEFHVDALRLDAVHAIFDGSAQPFLMELADAVRLEGKRLNRRVYTIAESDLNDERILRSKELGGCGIDAQWCDDMHHAIRRQLTGDATGYYSDFEGFEDIVKAYRGGFVHNGGFSSYRGRRHGNSSRDLAPERLVVCSQNHDQIGNRLVGERPTEVVSFEQLKLAAALILLSPNSPMLFMGEEYAEQAPFQFFVSHTDPDLVAAVRRGRKEEFAAFGWQDEPPDPQAVATFERCKLDHDLKQDGHHRAIRRFYQALIALRKEQPALAFPDRTRTEVAIWKPGSVMAVTRWAATSTVLTVYHFGDKPSRVSAECGDGHWQLLLDSSDVGWSGPGSRLPAAFDAAGEVTFELATHSAAVYMRQGPLQFTPET